MPTVQLILASLAALPQAGDVAAQPTFWQQLAGVLPKINACFNALSACLLLAGFVAIRRRRITWHLRCMLAALTSSGLFLVGYLTRFALTGSHTFPNLGWVRTFYLVLLFSHMVLAVVLLPLVARTLYMAWRRKFERHRWVARITWPIWMYVSVTGVVVYWMLYHLAAVA